MKKTILIPIMLLLFVSFVSATPAYNNVDEDLYDLTVNGTTPYPPNATNVYTDGGYGWTEQDPGEWGWYEVDENIGAINGTGVLVPVHDTAAQIKFDFNQTISEGTACAWLHYDTGITITSIMPDTTSAWGGARTDCGYTSNSATHFSCIGSAGGCMDGAGSVGLPASNGWVEICVYWNGTKNILLINGTEAYTDVCGDTYNSMGIISNANNGLDVRWDNIRVWEGAYEDEPQSAGGGGTTLNITLINMTSNGGDTTSPYETTDTTPSFIIETNENALCAISNANATYANMVSGANSYRNCTDTGGQSHNCTLHPDDALILNETDYAYIACTDIGETDDDTEELKMNMTTAEVETEGENAIMAGINSSVIWQYVPTIYSDQQIYIRDSANNQATGTFDRVASYNDQRWAFNYITSIESLISGLFNLTTAFYAAEYQDMTYQAVNDSVRILINETY